MTIRTLILTLAIFCTATHSAMAQGLNERRAAGLPEVRSPKPPEQDLEAIKIQQQVKPAFIIKPLVHRLTARRGQLLSFEFEIEANARPTRLEISPVAMSQQETGVIMPDPAAAPPDVIQMLTKPDVLLQVGESHTIKCQMRIPPGNAPFLSYGVLVKELPAEEAKPDADAVKPRVGIRFLTQYLLRADIQVLGVQGDSVQKLELLDGKLANRDGNAAILAYVNNPTDTSMEFQLRSHLVSRDTGKRYTSNLWMPVRETQPEPDRLQGRILGKTRLRMDGALTDSVFPGDYDLHLELTYQNRIYQKASFPVRIQSGDFPAQDATIVRVTRDISIVPPNVELSLRKGGNRLQSITIENGSQQKVVAKLMRKPLIGELSEWVEFRPDTLELRPGQKRKVLVTLGRKRDFEEHTYAYANVTVSPEVGEAIGSQNIPIALLTNSEATPQVEAEELKWKITPTTAGFEIPLRNTGQRHLELAGKLTLRDQFGRGFVVEDGYGKWVLPGQEAKLWFAFPQIPPPGTYSVKAEIEQGAGMAPVELDQTIQLRSALEERVSRKPDDSRN